MTVEIVSVVLDPYAPTVEVVHDHEAEVVVVDTGGVGPRGADGAPGPPGADGADGAAGPPGADGAGAILRNEAGTQLTSRASIKVSWLHAADNTAGGWTDIAPLSRIPRVTVHARATVNLNVNAPASTIDGWVRVGGNVLWLTGQTDPSQNGFWIVSRLGTSLVKAVHLDTLVAQAAVYVQVLNGTVNGGKFFRHSSSGSPVELSRPGFDFMVVDIDDFVLPSDAGDDVLAFNRAHDSGAGLITFHRRARYTFGSTAFVKRKIIIRGLATLNVASATEIRFNGSHAFHFLFGDTTPDTQGGWAHIEHLWLHYTGSYYEENDYHGLIFDTPGTATQITVHDFPGHGLHSTGGANLLRVWACRFFQTGLSGVYVAGADSNASWFAGIDATACGKRRKGCVRAQYILRLTNTTGTNVTIAPFKQIWKDTRYGLYYLSHDVGSGVIPANGGTLDIVVQAYPRWENPNGAVTPDTHDHTMENTLLALGINVLGSGTQFGYGTEFNQPSANTITSKVYSLEDLTGVTATNPSGTPSRLAENGDAHGIWDESFLACTWIACHSTAPGCRHFLSRKVAGGSVWIGCYCEIGNAGEVIPPNQRMGGHWADPIGMQSNGLHRDTTALRISPAILFTEGIKGVFLRLALNDTDTALQFMDTLDAIGLTFGRTTGGRLANAWAFLHSNQQAWGITDANDQRGPGMPVAPRGEILGNVPNGAGRMLFISALPTVSTPTDVYNVGDVVFLAGATTGQPWMHRCATKAAGSGTVAITWTNALNAP